MRNSTKSKTQSAGSPTVARLLKRLQSGGDLRKGKVRRVKSALRHESYVNALKLDVAADRLAAELIGQC